MDKCIYCGDTKLIRNITLGLSAEQNKFGLKYKARLGIRGVEPVHADLCASCGSITRFHVFQKDKNWVTGK